MPLSLHERFSNLPKPQQQIQFIAPKSAPQVVTKKQNVKAQERQQEQTRVLRSTRQNVMQQKRQAAVNNASPKPNVVPTSVPMSMPAMPKMQPVMMTQQQAMAFAAQAVRAFNPIPFNQLPTNPRQMMQMPGMQQQLAMLKGANGFTAPVATRRPTIPVRPTAPRGRIGGMRGGAVRGGAVRGGAVRGRGASVAGRGGRGAAAAALRGRAPAVRGGAVARGGRGGARGGAANGSAKSAVKSQEQLDADIDVYMGRDPTLEKLNKELDEYRSAKK